MRLFEAEQKRLTVTAQHSLAVTMFTDFITFVNSEIEPMTYRLKTANQPDCVSTLIRGDADIMLCYEGPSDPKLPFDDTFLNMTWGADRLIPVVGGSLISSLRPDGSSFGVIPVITFPQDSFFDRALSTCCYKDVEHDPKFEAICETAFSAGVREMALRGVGLAWIPLSLVSREIEAGKLIDLSDRYGSVTLKISLYARPASKLIETIVHDLKLLRTAT
jgi:DNA-binding transcriptional LysR family regulator